MSDFDERFIKPIVSASYPATLAGLCLTSMVVSNLNSVRAPVSLPIALLLGALFFLLSSFSIFFYRIYPTRRKLWTFSSTMYVIGLLCIITSVIILLINTMLSLFVS
jgi:hypothetical protein